MKKTICTIICILVFYVPLSNQLFAEEILDSHQESAILIEQKTGEILFEVDAHKRLAPASMTKMMTMLLVMEALADQHIQLDEKVKVSEYAASMGGSQVFLEAGEEMTVNDLLKAIAVASANDASVAIAEKIAGTEKQFVEKMNEKVAALQLENTHFTNSSGLPDKNLYSSAYDMAIIAKELLRHDSITAYTSIYEDYLRPGKRNEFWLVNTNKLVRFEPSVDGLKTGFTQEAMYCLTATAVQDDMRLVAVVMGAETAKERNNQIMSLFNFGFQHYRSVEIFPKGEVLESYEHILSKELSYDVVTSEAVTVVKKRTDEQEQFDVEVMLYDDVDVVLPLEKGTEVGMVRVLEAGEVVDESALVTNERVERGSLLQVMFRLWKSVMFSDN